MIEDRRYICIIYLTANFVLAVRKKSVSYIEHLIKYEVGLDFDRSSWWEVQDSDPVLTEICSLIEKGQAPVTKNKVLKRDFYKKYGDKLYDPGDLKRLYRMFLKGDLELNKNGILVKRHLDFKAIVLPQKLMKSVLSIVYDMFNGLTKSQLKKIVLERFYNMRMDQEIELFFLKLEILEEDKTLRTCA